MTELLDFARHEFRLNKVGKDGMSLRETCKAVEQQTGRMPEEGINPVPFPGELARVWHWFCDLHEDRDVGLGGTGPIGWRSMQAYFDLHGARPAVWEMKAIKALDQIAREAMKPKPEPGKKTSTRRG